MAVRDDCRHYVRRSTVGGDAIEQCKLAVNVSEPAFACPEGCLFYEPRTISDTGWQRQDPAPE
ncbi:MAG: hypothetical protein ACYDH6_08095 [Acidimicrobiales bacterium]